MWARTSTVRVCAAVKQKTGGSPQPTAHPGVAQSLWKGIGWQNVSKRRAVSGRPAKHALEGHGGSHATAQGLVSLSQAQVLPAGSGKYSQSLDLTRAAADAGPKPSKVCLLAPNCPHPEYLRCSLGGFLLTPVHPSPFSPLETQNRAVPLSLLLFLNKQTTWSSLKAQLGANSS